MTEYEQFIRTEAKRRGIDPDTAVTVAKMEGGVDVATRTGDFDTGNSFWAYQLHYGGEGYEHFGTVAGMGNGFTAVTGWAPGDPTAWRDAARWALDRAKWSGWSAWYGAAKAGIVGMRGIDVNYPWSATPDDEWDYKHRGAPIMPQPLPFNPDAPCDLQPDDWSCSIQSVQWLLRSIGRNPDGNNPVTDPWLRSQLVPGIVSPDVGLRDASGQQMADWVTREYGAEMGFTAMASPVVFDDVVAGAGVNPMMCGGRTYGPGGHWVGIRRVLPDGSLELANPAPGYTGTGPSLDRAEWDARGPWSAIWIDRMSTLAPPEPVPPAIDKAAVTARLREILAYHDAYAAQMHADLEGVIAMMESLP